MEAESYPSVLKQTQQSLAPYLKERQETLRIRRIVATYLVSHHRERKAIGKPISLPIFASPIKMIAQCPRGTQRELLRWTGSNFAARNEYAQIRKAHRRCHDDISTGPCSTIESNGSCMSLLDDIIEFNHTSQRHDRLCILQDYANRLLQKAGSSYDLIYDLCLQDDKPSCPQIPMEVLNGASKSLSTATSNLHKLMEQLEKSVFRAKLQLRREQKLLAQIQLQNNDSWPGNAGIKLNALGTTRNYLIHWIEGNLENGEEVPSGIAGNEHSNDAELVTPKCMKLQPTLLKAQYSHYTKSRQKLVSVISRRWVPRKSVDVDSEVIYRPTKTLIDSSDPSIHDVKAFLEDIHMVSNQQKAIIQQKSHMTVTLARQIKSTNRSLDRLAGESHLLPTHPMPLKSSDRKTLGFPLVLDEGSNQESPETYHRTQPWLFSARQAAVITGDLVSGNLEEGAMAIMEAQETLMGLFGLVGNEVNLATEGHPTSAGVLTNDDIWAGLKGDLCAIRK